jgi:hypothetical protein
VSGRINRSGETAENGMQTGGEIVALAPGAAIFSASV